MNKALESEPSDFDVYWVSLIAWQNFLWSQWALCFLEHRFIKPLWCLSEKMWPSLRGGTWCIYSHWCCFWRSVWMLNHGVEEIALRDCWFFLLPTILKTNPFFFLFQNTLWLCVPKCISLWMWASSFETALWYPSCLFSRGKKNTRRDTRLRTCFEQKTEWQREGNPPWSLGL